MKSFISSVVLLLTLFGASTMKTEAKAKKTPKVYIFGFSASFKNPVIYFTDIQVLDSAWIDSKTKFLLERDSYSAQLKDYLTDTTSDPHRTCMVVFSTDKAKAEKKYMKLKNNYTVKANAKDGYDVKYLSDEDFKFSLIDISEEVSEEQ